MKARHRTMEWVGDERGHLRLLDQTRLPTEVVYRDIRSVEDLWHAIKQLQVRGAPAIGVAAAYGMVLAAQHDPSPAALEKARNYLATARPTAVNLFWALDRMSRVPPNAADLLAEAHAIYHEDVRTCLAIGRHGAALLKDGMGVLTHCNAGALATADYGTALAVIFIAAEQGKRLHVYADETRPLLQGARLTAWELRERGIPSTLICDGMAGQVMKEGRIQTIVVGADRIAANGDTANKIGTYGVAVLAKHHHIPVYVAAPASTFDLTLADGSGIPIEQRDAREITHGFGRQTAPDGMAVYNPAFDVTPASLLSGIITEWGLIAPVNQSNVERVLRSRQQVV